MAQGCVLRINLSAEVLGILVRFVDQTVDPEEDSRLFALNDKVVTFFVKEHEVLLVCVDD